MKYENILPATFIARPNRFIAHVEVHGKKEIAHVKNTGRCKELLIPGTQVFLQESTNPARKTKYDLISVYKGSRLINMDSQIPNKVFGEYAIQLFPDMTLIKAETTYNNSRFDFYVESPNKKIFVEVKGVTLEENNMALFPDAPTERGVKHILELCQAVQAGYEAWIVFVVQMENVLSFSPNGKMHPEFAQALAKAASENVHILAFDCIISPDSIVANKTIPVILK